MFIADRLTLDARRKTRDGYLAVRAKASRIGTYDYLGSEIDPDNQRGLRDAGIVKVLRDERTVFDEAAARSFIGKPITDNHPTQPVTAANWKDHARGMVMGAMRDGDYLAFDLLLTDADTIKKVEDGKRELSNGYAAELEFGDFQAADGTKCVARQVSISGNHCALVDHGRAGSECRISDAASCDPIPRQLLADLAAHLLDDGQTYRESDANDKNSPHQRRETVDKGVGQVATKIIIVDGLNVEVTEDAERAIVKLQGQLADSVKAKDKAETDVARLTTDNATLTADKAKLEQQLKDAELTPAKLQDAAKAYAATVDKAKKLAPSLSIADEMDEPAIRRAVVAARLGDAAKDWSDEQVAISFDTLASQTADAKVDPIRGAIASAPVHVADASAVRDLARASQY
jgi:hypothetical protein